eukprot:1179488-Prorocentrum_minimum.AAC.1
MLLEVYAAAQGARLPCRPTPSLTVPWPLRTSAAPCWPPRCCWRCTPPHRVRASLAVKVGQYVG